MNENNPQIKNINIYPNPTKSEFHLEVNSSIKNEIQSIKIYNLLGELVFNSNQYLEIISTSLLSTGMYIVDVNFSEYKISKKLIIE